MICGLIRGDAVAVPLENIECTAEVSGDFGIYTLVQKYRNESGAPIDVRYIFPIPVGGSVISISAKSGEDVIASEIIQKKHAHNMLNTKADNLLLSHRGSIIETHIGVVAPDAEITVSVKYFCPTDSTDQGFRIVIPVVIAPRYASHGSQMAIESVFDRKNYRASLNVVYRGNGIIGVNSPSHEINAEVDSYGARVSLAEDSITDRDIVIDIAIRGKNSPAMYYTDTIACYSFTPKINIYNHEQGEYIFLIDTSRSMGEERLNRVKNAVLICICTLKKGDLFNIIAFADTHKLFSKIPMPMTDESLSEAKSWLDSLTVSAAEGRSELLRPVISACERSRGTVLLFTDGMAKSNTDILLHVQNHGGIVFHTFCLGSGADGECLERLAFASGGRATLIFEDENTEREIIKVFNRIIVPAVKNAAVTFDVPSLNIIPKFIKRIHAGERFFVTAKFTDTPPRELAVKGEFMGEKCVMKAVFESPCQAGEELLYHFTKARIDELRNLLTGNEIRDSLIKKQIASISESGGLLTEETALVTFRGGKDKQRVVDAAVLLSASAHYNKNTQIHSEGKSKKTKQDGVFKTIMTQHADGSFTKPKISPFLHTAHILHSICTECEKADLFVWHLRKSVSYILDTIERSESAVIPEDVIAALGAWHQTFGANDEISQKVEALLFLYGKNI
ncbi:MAG: hypothetical protein BWY15_01275 [Firmicutes bacterium ADurb.Bin193]|nr:MAG: hypothetical protein BWY15_01275 [Firmicutes bacterium ADurb.Bin193]